MIEPDELKTFARKMFPGEDYSSLDYFIDNAPKTDVISKEYAKHIVNTIINKIDDCLEIQKYTERKFYD